MVSVFALSIKEFGAVFEMQFPLGSMIYRKSYHRVFELHRREMSDETP